MPVFIIDDNDDDIFFLRRSIFKTGIQNPIVTFRDGELLINFLSDLDSRAQNGAAVKSSVLFLDLKMPGASGFEVLEWIRAHPRISDHLKIVIHSSSNEAIDIDRAIDLGAHKFIQKQADIDALNEVWAKFLRIT